jgi:hypothetical protein
LVKKQQSTQPLYEVRSPAGSRHGGCCWLFS